MGTNGTAETALRHAQTQSWRIAAARWPDADHRNTRVYIKNNAPGHIFGGRF